MPRGGVSYGENVAMPSRGGFGGTSRGNLSIPFKTCACLLGGIYVLSCSFKVLSFEDVVASVYKAAFIDRSVSTGLAIGLCVLEGLLALSVLYEVALVPGAMVSAAYSMAGILLQSYTLWTGELEPCGCAGRILKPVQDWEHHILLVVAIVMLVLSSALYLGIGRSKASSG